MPDFWRHSGFHLLLRDANGHLSVNDDLLRAYFARPEVAPIESSCAHERALFTKLMESPRIEVSQEEINAIADPDARESYGIVLKFRQYLLQAGTIEGCYMSLFRGADGEPREFSSSGLPPLFVEQMAQMILRNILDTCDDALQVRSAELFFRHQKAHIQDGIVLLADAETVEQLAEKSRSGSHYGDIGRLIVQAQSTVKSIEVDVLGQDNASMYWARDERHDTAIELNYGRDGLRAFCSVLEKWIAHFFRSEVTVKPVRSIESARLAWYCGLDRDATALLNDLYNGVDLDYERSRRIVALMELTFAEPAQVRIDAKNKPIYLALTMDANNEVRMKPQNLLINLPFVLPE